MAVRETENEGTHMPVSESKDMEGRNTSDSQGWTAKSQRRSDIRDYSILGVLAAAVGIIVGMASLAFRFLISLVHNVFFLGELSAVYDSSQHTVFNFGWLVLLVPALGGLIVGLMVKYGSKDVKGHGVPEVMYAISKKGGRIKPGIGTLKLVASAVTIGTGGSAGKEGPIIQIGASGGSVIGQAFNLSDEKVRILVGCGAAAGIAATFNTPIAGILFAIELILLEFRTKSFVPLAISSVVGTVVAQIFMGNELAFPLADIASSYVLGSPGEMLLFAVLGLMAGLVGLFFIKFFYRIEDFFDSLKLRNFTKPMMGGFLVGVIGLLLYRVFGNYFIFGTGYASIMPVILTENISGDLMLAGGKLALFMLLLMFLKMLATALTLGSGGSGGLLVPSLWIGAMLGGAFGIIVNMAFPDMAAPFGVYALVGMAAFFAGTSRATLTAIVIIMEMTGSYSFMLPLILACVVADAVSKVMYRDTIYTIMIRRRGVHYTHDREINLLETYTVEDVMTTPVECISGDFTLGDVSEKMLRSGHQAFPYIDREGNLCGIVTSNDMKDAINDGMDRSTPFSSIKKVCQAEVAYPDEELQAVLDRMIEGSYGHVPVVRRSEPIKLVGFITRKDIMKVFNIRATERKDRWKRW